MITYLLQVTLCLAFFYAFYHLTLHKETLFQTNRIYLLCTLLLSLVLPLIRIYVQDHQYQPSIVTAPYVYIGSYLNTMTDAIIITPRDQDISWFDALLIVYLAGVLWMSIKMIREVVSILKMKRDGIQTWYSGQQCILSAEVKSPFSFFNIIYLPAQHHFTDNELAEIISHEKVHVRDRHTMDILFMEIISIGLWPSPMVYLFRKKLREVHEFLADAEVLKNTPWESYASFLVAQKGVGLQNHLSNQMFYSQLKNRLTMMTQKPSRFIARFKYLGLIPILLLSLVVFSFREKSLPGMASDPKIVLTVTQDKKYFLDSNEVPFDQLEQTLSDRIINNIERKVVLHIDSTLTVGDLAEVLTLGYKLNINFILETTDQKSDLTKFLIVIEKTENELKLTCQNGCAWKNLSFSSSASKEPQAIDQNGMTTLSRTHPLNDSELSNFLFTIKAVDDGVRLKGIEGTAWIDLAFNRPEHKWFQAIDQNGMVTLDSVTSATETDPINYHTRDTLPTTFITAYGMHKPSTDPKSDVLKSNTSADEVFTFVEEMPHFPILDNKNGNSTEAMYKYIYEAIKYPKEDREKGKEGMVVAKFIVESDGTISNAKVLRGASPGLDAEALRVINGMNDLPQKWIPGRHQGKAVPVEFTLPFKFVLEVRQNNQNQETKKVEPNQNETNSNTDTHEVSLFSMSPNPVNDIFKINFSVNVQSATIMDVSGHIVWQKKFQDNQAGTQSIDVLKWTPGTYTVQALSGTQTYAASFVVQH